MYAESELILNMKSWWVYLKKLGIEVEPVVGVDEAGRGPLAGPLMVVGVILPRGHRIKGLNDSKLLTEKRREELFIEIQEKGEVFVESASNKLIDKHGILVMTKRLMRKIILDSRVKMVLVDAESVPNVRDVIQLAITKGDMKVDCIAAASIVAKVTRDRLMMKYSQKYPGYGLAVHKGYGTRQHREAIGELGLSKIHRKSFCRGLDKQL